MRKTLTYMVVDTETATLPFANEIANGDTERKKRIAIARPLVYDIGWTITNRKGEILDSKQFLIAETFAVPSIFNTAYYAEKRPIYLEKLKRGETSIKTWNEVMEIFSSDLKKVDAVGAYNSMFDFKKAIPFTELYISKLYSPNYYEWERVQRAICYNIAMSSTRQERNPDFDENNFNFRGNNYPLFDLWGLATSHLLNNATYKRKCLEHGSLTASGVYFKTSAESTYQYLSEKYDFVEAHTALDDATIETAILAKIASRHAISIGIKFFPFRDLGHTYDFCQRRKVADLDECQVVYNAIAAYIDEKGVSNYTKGLMSKLEALAEYANI